MPNKQKTIIVTGASQGIGADVVQSFIDRSYNVVANSRNISKSGAFKASDELALVDGDIGEKPVVSIPHRWRISWLSKQSARRWRASLTASHPDALPLSPRRLR
ncbi:hypothetical protein [Tunturiibacter lichenicola]|uniref:hypothetical protein n=1 Tax=Tunturiibacter lichenicola TaxID=2051959 RepID=UPI0021B1B112|nr:hypothetical protein [Edaphobacter lichenicola]